MGKPHYKDPHEPYCPSCEIDKFLEITPALERCPQIACGGNPLLLISDEPLVHPKWKNGPCPTCNPQEESAYRKELCRQERERQDKLAFGLK